MKKLIIKYLLIAFLVSLFNIGYNQESKQITNQNLIWYGYFNTLNFSEKLFLVTEIQERHFINPIEQSQLVLRSHIHKPVSNGWDIATGMCLMLQNTKSKLNEYITVPELRPHLEFNAKQKLKKIFIEHRYKLEARFFHRMNKERTELEDGYEFGNFRLRYRLQFTVPLLTYGKSKLLKMKLKFSNEIHINAGKTVVHNSFDQNRFYGGLIIGITKGINFEIGYLNWYQSSSMVGNFYNRNILRFTITHTINLKK